MNLKGTQIMLTPKGTACNFNILMENFLEFYMSTPIGFTPF